MGHDKVGEGWSDGVLDKVVPSFPEKVGNVGPKHPAWKTRVKLEVKAIMRYLSYLKSTGVRPWFQLVPSNNPRLNFMVWKGVLTVPTRPDVTFGTRILLTSEYPKVPPRAFAEMKILNYCGKIYTKNIWKDPEDRKQYVMICHDHLSEQDAWNPRLGIVHFFIREVWYWWGAQQNLVLQEWDKRIQNGMGN